MPSGIYKRTKFPIKQYEIQNCLKCKTDFLPLSPTQKYCGSLKNNIGCSPIVFKELKRESHRKEYAIRKSTGKIRIQNMKNKYGLSLDDYDKLLIKQNGVCAICKHKETKKGIDFLPVDHNHKTGKVRGLLCNACNWGIGHLKDDIEILENAIKYLKQ